MADSLSQGELLRFLNKHHFIVKGKKKNCYFGFINQEKVVITFHYHKDNQIIPKGTISSLAKSCHLSTQESIDCVKERK